MKVLKKEIKNDLENHKEKKYLKQIIEIDYKNLIDYIPEKKLEKYYKAAFIDFYNLKKTGCEMRVNKSISLLNIWLKNKEYDQGEEQLSYLIHFHLLNDYQKNTILEILNEVLYV